MDRRALARSASSISRRGTRRAVARPSILRGLDEVVPSPHGHLVAVGFADPAYPGPAQASDVWILDTATGKYTHLPGMPAQVDLKFSSMAWARDGRLVLLLQGGGRTVLAVWRPGAHTLPLRVVHLPAAHRRQRHLRAAARPVRPGLAHITTIARALSRCG